MAEGPSALIARNEMAVRAFLDGMESANRETVRSALHADAVLILPRPTMLGKVIKGRENLTDFVVNLSATVYRDRRAIYGTVLVGETSGVAEWRLQASLASSGSPYDQFYCWLFDLDDGQIIEIREYIDTHYGLQVNGAPGAEAIEAHAAR